MVSGPLEQGGIAGQQADVAATAIALEAGADVRPEPFRAVLRALLLTGSTPLYLRAGGGGAGCLGQRDRGRPGSRLSDT
jgi:hypothetical protein